MEHFILLELTWQGWLTISVIIGCFLIVVFSKLPEDFTFLGGLFILLFTGILNSKEALTGFSSSGMMTVAALYIVVTGLQETGGLSMISHHLLGYPKTYSKALLRLLFPVIGLSAFLNNTPVVAMFIPVVTEWCSSIKQQPSKFLIPLSYASIFGGICTLIGTSTNLVVNGLVQQNFHGNSLGMFEITKLGIPCAVIGILYLLLFSKKLLPSNPNISEVFSNTNEYILEVEVSKSSLIIGKTIEDAGLRNLPGGFIAEINRGEQIISAVTPNEIIKENDKFVIVGNINSLKSIYKRKGLTPSANQIFKIDSPRHQRCLIEAIVSDTCPLINKTIKEGRFRNRYNAVVIAIARKGKRLSEKIGDIKIKPGDMLLIECHAGFIQRQKESHDFYLLNEVENIAFQKHSKAPIAMIILAAMVLLAAFEIISMFTAAFGAALAMLIFKCCTATQAKRSIEWKVLIVIASTLGLGYALTKTGAALIIAKSLLIFSSGNPWISLLIITAVTTILTEVITNNGAAAIIFPIAVSTAEQLHVNPMPFIFSLMIAASASFATPIGYQTNLMVYAPGGYSFKDYFKIGIPLNIIMCLTSVLLAPLIWGFKI